MSTRCQVKIVGNYDEQAVTLYHHCDGYPSNMVPLIANAYKPSWEYGRTGKVASFLCAVDPGQFEPEASHDLHGDIEWYYVLTLDSEGHMADVPKWTLTVYDVAGDADSVDDMRQVFKGTLKAALKNADKMEEPYEE